MLTIAITKKSCYLLCRVTTVPHLLSNLYKPKTDKKVIDDNPSVITIALYFCVGLSLSGCSDPLAEVQQEMAKDRSAAASTKVDLRQHQQPSQHIIDFDVSQLQSAHFKTTYNANNSRSPFRSPVTNTVITDKQVNTNAQSEQQSAPEYPVKQNRQTVSFLKRPDPNRPLQALEYFDLSQFIYRGRMLLEGDKPQGLVQRPDGIVVVVEVGNYIGRNNGQIVEITPTQINIVEVMLDDQNKRIQNSVSLVSPL